MTGAKWPPANQPKSPCPTLVVVGSITKMMNAKQEAKRFTPAPGNVAVGATISDSNGLHLVRGAHPRLRAARLQMRSRTPPQQWWKSCRV